MGVSACHNLIIIQFPVIITNEKGETIIKDLMVQNLRHDLTIKWIQGTPLDSIKTIQIYHIGTPNFTLNPTDFSFCTEETQ